VAPANDRLARVLLRYSSRLRFLRRLPVLGSRLSWLGERIVPRDTRTWAQVESGPAAGIWLRLNPRTGLDTLRGAGEPQVQDAMLRYLRPGMTFYDLGANIGFFSLLGARLVAEQGRVVAFEADPEIAARLREHVEYNKFRSVTIAEKAVWSRASKVFFERVDSAASPDRGLGHVAAAPTSNTIEVEAVTLDDFARIYGPVPDLIKCDVEGAEVDVLHGAQMLLAEKRPTMVCEIHGEENRHALLAEFSRFSYTCTNCGERHLLALPNE
jgi:FkbM family methyltransferase